MIKNKNYMYKIGSKEPLMYVHKSSHKSIISQRRFIISYCLKFNVDII